MAKNFGKDEHNILRLFSVGAVFVFNNARYVVQNSGKPFCKSGEPKTDIYVKAQSETGTIELKISFKKKNAEFIENKINANRAEQIFGKNWQEIIWSATRNIQNDFYAHHLIYKKNYGRTQKGAITLGWKFELLNVKSGDLSSPINLSPSQLIDIYAGTNLPSDKKNAFVNGIQIENCGVANCILFETEKISTIQQAINCLISINDYVVAHPLVFFACKALNYRTFEEKYDGNRPLAVFVKWFAENNKLNYELIFTEPLLHGGNDAFYYLNNALKLLGISNTDNISEKDLFNTEILYQ